MHEEQRWQLHPNLLLFYLYLVSFSFLRGAGAPPLQLGVAVSGVLFPNMLDLSTGCHEDFSTSLSGLPLWKHFNSQPCAWHCMVSEVVVKYDRHLLLTSLKQ